MLGSFTFVLHTHLPYVLHHGKWPHGSDWLSEAVAECYIPILGTLERLQAEGLAPKISMDFSPINLEQLADPEFKGVFIAYCAEKILAAEEDYVYFAQQGEHHLQPLAEYWREFYSNARTQFLEKYHGDIVGGFRQLSDAGVLDAMTCGATHGYFPLLLRDDNIRGQINCAVETHEKHFGKRPRGIWLPECGYRPRYQWSPTVGPESFRRHSEERAGVEELVAEAGLEYFVVDGALTQGGKTVPPYQPFAKALHQKYLAEVGANGEPPFGFDPNRSLTDIYWVDSRKPVGMPHNMWGEPGGMPGNAPAVFSRDPKSASRVWSADLGYPGAGVYLDFHKKHHNSGLRYWKITGVSADLAYKQPYLHDQTEWQLDLDAGDFVSLVKRELEDHAKTHRNPGVLAAPFDTELFGHWWFEGPRFLEKVMRRLTTSNPAQNESEKIVLTDCAEALDNYAAPRTTISLPEGSWGEGGHHFVWTNKEVAWMWDTIYPLEDRFLRAIQMWGKPTGLPELSMQGKPELSMQDTPELSMQGKPELSMQGKPESSMQGKPELSMQGKPELSMQGKPESSIQGKPESSMQDKPELSMQDTPELSMQDKPKLSMQDKPVGLSHILEQAARELLLLEASDWEFVISTQGAIEYSKTRFAEHAGFLTRLLDMAEKYDANTGLSPEDSDFLKAANAKDAAFQNIDLGWWGKAGSGNA